MSKVCLGFSYCQKPNLCPEGKFSSGCSYALSSRVCENCPIGTFLQSKKEKIFPFFLTDSFDFAKFLFHTLESSDKDTTLFIVQTCPWAFENFKTFFNLFKINLLLFPLKGDVCQNFSSFLRAEKGDKRGRSFLDEAQKAALFTLLKEL